MGKTPQRQGRPRKGIYGRFSSDFGGEGSSQSIRLYGSWSSKHAAHLIFTASGPGSSPRRWSPMPGLISPKETHAAARASKACGTLMQPESTPTSTQRRASRSSARQGLKTWVGSGGVLGVEFCSKSQGNLSWQLPLENDLKSLKECFLEKSSKAGTSKGLGSSKQTTESSHMATKKA